MDPDSNPPLDGMQQGTSMPSRRYRPRRFLILTGATLLLLEFVLQVGSVVVWFVHRDGAKAGAVDGERVVLCVGDSFTYGVGSSSDAGSYPTQLHELVRGGLGEGWRVVNEGWPGQSSRDVLENLDGPLRRLRPDVVYVLVGANDGWKRPEHLVLASQPKVAASSPRADQEGLDRFTGRGPPSRESSRDATIPGRLDPGSGETPRAGRRSYRFVWRTKLLLMWAWGKLFPEGANTADRITALRARFEDESSEPAAMELLQALREDGDEEQSAKFVARMVELFPGSGRVSAQVAWQHFMAGDIPAAVAAIDQALSQLLASETALRARLLRARALAVLATDPERSAVDVAAAARLDGRPLTKDVLEDLLDEVTPARIVHTYESHVAQIIARCRALAATPVLLAYPTTRARLERSMRKVAAGEGVDWIDLATAFARRIEGREPADFFAPDGHCNDAGYGVMAAIVMDDLLRRVGR